MSFECASTIQCAKESSLLGRLQFHDLINRFHISMGQMNCSSSAVSQSSRFVKVCSIRSQQLMWISIYVVISLAISFIVPFPYSLPIIIGVVILLSFYVRRRMFKRAGRAGSSMFGGDSGLIWYYCMNCGTKHNQVACPKCGSKMKKVG